jgi:stage II sporulation protein D
MNTAPAVNPSKKLFPARLSVLIAFTAVLLLCKTSAHAGGQVMIRAGLVSGIGTPASITATSASPFTVTDPASKDPVASVDGKPLTLTANNGKIDISIGGAPCGTFAGPIRLAPSADGSLIQLAASNGRKGKYRGIMEIRGGAHLFAINELELEDYLRGVIPIEVPRMFQPEAQKALAIAARTYAVKSLGRHAAEGYNLCDTTNCQCFAGANRDADWVDKLVDETRGQIITHNNDPIAACYSTDCGGSTLNNEDAGFGKSPWPYLRAVRDEDSSGQDYCSSSPHHIWTKTFTLDEINARLSKTAKVGKVCEITVAETDSGGHAKVILVKGETGEYRMTGNRFRETLGLAVIKSTMFTITSADTGYRFDGSGYGHAVGLCAFGANGMAKAGKPYADILKHYYTGVEIKQVSDINLRVSQKR